MESCVTSIIAPIDLADILLQTVQNHVLQGGGGELRGFKVNQRWRLLLHGSTAHANDDKCKHVGTW